MEAGMNDHMGKTILVVDDLELNRSIVNKIFGDTHLVLMAENGLDAMGILHRQQVDIVLLDIQMPLMDGYEVIRAMKAESRLAEIPILVTTGAVDKSERKAFDLGADDYLTQPYDPYIMRKRVENLIDRYELREMRHAANENEKTMSMLEGLGIAYWEWTPEGGYRHSPEYEKYAISQMENEKIWDQEAPFAYVHPDDVPLMRRFMKKYPDDEVKKSSVVRCKMRDGSYQWTELFSFAETSIDGHLERLVSAMRDVDKEWIASRSVEQKNLELKHIIDAISGGVATCRISDVCQLLSMSDGMARRLGYTPAEVAGSRNQDALRYVHPSDRTLLMKRVKEALQTGKSQVFAYRMIIRDGTCKWFRASFYPAGESDGCPILYVVFTDIAEVNADYVEALNQTNEIIFIADWESRDILYCNQAAADMAGMAISDLFGKKCSRIPMSCDERCASCTQDQLTYDELLIRPITVGKQYFQKKGKRILWNGRKAFIEYVIDMTAEHNMTEKMVFERNLLSTATKTLFPMCIISNLSQNTYKIVEYDGWTTKKAATEGCFDDLIAVGASTIPEEDREAFVSAFSRESLLKAHTAGRKTVPLTHRQIGDDGAIRWNQTTAIFADQLLNDDLFVITFAYNVDQQKKAEAAVKAALIEAEHANMAKTAFLSRVSHDMRTPLNGILGLTALLKDTITDSDALRDLDELEVSGRYLLELINDTLDISRIETGKLELHPVVYDGRMLFNNALRLVTISAKKKNVKINVSAPDLPFTLLYVDVGRLEQIVLNIIGNSIKFTPEGGLIDISMKNISVENGVITDQLVVADSGIGMSKEYLPHIFEAFSQEDTSTRSSSQGTGLGMTITKQLLSLMGGDITVESEPGKGTTFTLLLRFPVATEQQRQEWTSNRQIGTYNMELMNKRILLCEDHPLNAKIAIRLLEAKGMLAEHAQNGQIGVEMFRNSAVGYYDAVLMDIRMPVMDGIDAAKEIRSLPRADARTVPIIAMTANAFAEDVEQTKKAGMDAHLSKPIQPELLYDTLAKKLDVKHLEKKQMILLVDDVEVNRAVIRATLEDDYELLEAENGKQAMEILKSTKGLDAVITDIQMPEMDGVELIREIRSDSKYRHVVIIANTQFGDPEQEEKLLALGANDFVYKPTTPKIVEIRVRNALRR